MTGARPLVTIGIPCLNEERYIEACLACVFAQDYPPDRLEIIIADGGSSDRTREILSEMARAHSNLRWIDNPGRIQAIGMNEIIRVARGDILVRLDAHAEYADDYVSECVSALERTGADNVGGAQRARSKSWFQRALCAAYESPAGVGGAKYKSDEAEGFVDTVWGGAFPLRVFSAVGMYDPGAVVNEDSELNQRILAAGGRIYLSPKIRAYYYPRDSFSALAKQYFRYGMGRARTVLKHRSLVTPRPVIPFAAVSVGTLLWMTRRFHPLTAPLLLAYGAATGIEAVRVGRREGAWAIPVVWAIFPVMHVCHGVGFGAGLVRFLRRPDWNTMERLDTTGDAPA
jgi:glycosyltransferase involved in cell wall biosynthesis